MVANVDEVHADWLKSEGQAHIKTVATHYGIYEHLFGYAYFVPRIPLDIKVEIRYRFETNAMRSIWFVFFFSSKSMKIHSRQFTLGIHSSRNMPKMRQPFRSIQPSNCSATMRQISQLNPIDSFAMLSSTKNFFISEGRKYTVDVGADQSRWASEGQRK